MKLLVRTVLIAPLVLIGSCADEELGAPHAPPPATDTVAAPAKGRRLDVTVVDRSSSKEPGAVEVTWIGLPEAPPPKYWEQNGLLEIDSLVSSAHVRSKTDASGRASIDVNSGHGLLVAQAPSRWGVRELRPADGPQIQVEMFDDIALQIQVTDSDGKPTSGGGIVVAGCARAPRMPCQDLLKVPSAGSGGLITLPHAGYFLSRSPDMDLRVRVDAALMQPVFRELERAPMPSTPLNLTVPPCGPVTVRLESAGKSVSGPLIVEMKVQGRPKEVAVPEWGDMSVVAVGGAASFPMVQVGSRLSLSTVSGLYESAHLEVDGPSKPGEVVECVLQLKLK